MEATIANLESLLQERDASLTKAQNQMRGLSKLAENKSEQQKPRSPALKTEEEKKADEERKAAERKARGNNGARRNMHFEMETVEKDVYPSGYEGLAPFSTRDAVRYIMIPPRFIKEVRMRTRYCPWPTSCTSKSTGTGQVRMAGLSGTTCDGGRNTPRPYWQN